MDDFRVYTVCTSQQFQMDVDWWVWGAGNWLLQEGKMSNEGMGVSTVSVKE